MLILGTPHSLRATCLAHRRAKFLDAIRKARRVDEGLDFSRVSHAIGDEALVSHRIALPGRWGLRNALKSDTASLVAINPPHARRHTCRPRDALYSIPCRCAVLRVRLHTVPSYLLRNRRPAVREPGSLPSWSQVPGSQLGLHSATSSAMQSRWPGADLAGGERARCAGTA